MNELNLIPSSLKSSRNKRIKNQSTIYIIIIGIAILFFGIYFPNMEIDRLQKEEADLKSQVEARINVLNERDKIVSFVNSTNELINKVESFDKSRIKVYDLITKLQAKTPADVAFSSLNYSAGSISIAALTNNYNSPAVFVGNLQEAELFKDTKLTNISKDQNNNFTFNVSITTK